MLSCNNSIEERVYWFNETVFPESEYQFKSNNAHKVLGIGLLLQIIIWTLHLTSNWVYPVDITKNFMNLFNSYKLAGLISMAMGFYLLIWIFALKYQQLEIVLMDITQVQHLTIALNLIAAGLIEFLNIGFQILPSKKWNKNLLVLGWQFNLQSVGLQFIAHSQLDYTRKIQHLFLGSLLILGTSLLVLEKIAAINDKMTESVYMLISALFFGICAVILIKFNEMSESGHKSIQLTCNASFYLSLAGIFLSILTLLMSLFTVMVTIYKHKITNKYILFEMNLEINDNV